MPTLQEMEQQVTLPRNTQLQAPSGNPLDAILNFMNRAMSQTPRQVARVGETLTGAIPESVKRVASGIHDAPLPRGIEQMLADPSQPHQQPEPPQQPSMAESVEVGEPEKENEWVGRTLSELLEAKGEPRGRLDMGDMSVLSYDDMMITVKDGKAEITRPVKVEGEPDATAAQGEEEPKTNPIRKMMMVEEMISGRDITERGASLIRGRVARKAIEEGADPELVGSWVGGGFEGIGRYYKDQREAMQGTGGGGEATTLQRQVYMDFLDKLSNLDRSFANDLEKESGRDVWDSNIFFGIGAKPDRQQALLTLLERPEYSPLLVNPPPALAPVVNLAKQDMMRELQRRQAGGK